MRMCVYHMYWKNNYSSGKSDMCLGVCVCVRVLVRLRKTLENKYTRLPKKASWTVLSKYSLHKDTPSKCVSLLK